MLPSRTDLQSSCLHVPLTDLHMPPCLNILQIALALAVHSVQAGSSAACLHGSQAKHTIVTKCVSRQRQYTFTAVLRFLLEVWISNYVMTDQLCGS